MSIVERIASSHAAVHVDLEHGGSIVHFGSSEDSRDNVLAQFEPAAHSTPVRSIFSDSRADWLRHYGGGWQLLTPNAGDECTVDGVNHPFHGEVSKIAWARQRRSETSMTITAQAVNSLIVTRTMCLVPGRAELEVTTTLKNESDARVPAIFVEHIALASGDDMKVQASERSVWAFPAEPNVLAAERPWSSEFAGPIEVGSSRVMHLFRGSEGWVELRREHRDSVRVEWNPAELPYLWYWQERRTQGFPFYGRCDVAGLEPASAVFADGLAEAAVRGDAWWLDVHETRSATVRISLIPGAIKEYTAL